jgi:hypothetical protein
MGFVMSKVHCNKNKENVRSFVRTKLIYLLPFLILSFLLILAAIDNFNPATPSNLADGRYIIAKDTPASLDELWTPFYQQNQDNAQSQEKDGPKELTHFRWEPFGRTFKTEKPNQYVYKSNPGQRNVKLANGKYAPYVWDEENKILKFANNSIHLKDNEMEFWHKSQKVHQVSFHPEVKEQGIWQKETAVVSDLRTEEIKTTGPTDNIKITYDLETKNQKSTIALRAGGFIGVLFSFDTEAKESGEYRLAVEHDNTNLEPIYANIPDSSQPAVHIGYFSPDDGFYWRWQADEEKHYAETRPNILALLLNQDEYQAGERKITFPDQWGETGIANTNDDCQEDESGTVDLDGLDSDGDLVGDYYGTLYRTGLRFQNVTIAPNPTSVDSGTQIEYDCPWIGTSFNFIVYGLEGDTPAWSAGVGPSSRTRTTASITVASPTVGNNKLISGANFNAAVKEILDTSWTSGYDMGFELYHNNPAYNESFQVEDYSTIGGGTAAARLTIVYSAEGSSTESYQKGDGKGTTSETDDSSISSGFANMGTNTTLEIDSSAHYHSVIKFPNIFGSGANQIPLGSTINSATLTLEVTGTGNNVDVYQLIESWVESEVTWDLRSTGVSWTNAGADGTGSRYATAVGTLVVSTTGPKDVTVTATVQNWSDGEANEGWLLADTGSDGVDIFSSEYGTVSSRPKLTVNFTPPAMNIGDGTSPADKSVDPSSTNNAVDAFTLFTNTGTDTVTALTVTFTGSDVSEVASSGVKIYEDNGGTANEWDATDTLIDTASFSGTTASFTGLNISVDTSPTQYLVTYDIVAGATSCYSFKGAITAGTAVTYPVVNNDTTDATLTISGCTNYDQTYTLDTLVAAEADWDFVGPDLNDLQAVDTDGAWCWTDTGSVSSGTGPPSGVACVYTETSSPVTAGDEFFMTLTNPVDAGSYALNVTFDRCTQGDASAHLYFEAWNGSGWVPVDDWAGDSTTTFTSEGPYDFSSYDNSDFKIRFRTVVGGTTYQNDMSVDTIRIYGNGRPPSTIIGDGTSPSNKTVEPSTANNAVNAFTLRTNTGTDTVTALTVTFTGDDVSDVASSGVKIYEDNGGTANEWDATDTLKGTASFSGTTADVTVSISVDTAATQYLVTYDTAAGATDTNTLQGAITAGTSTTYPVLNNDTTDATITIMVPVTTIGDGTSPANKNVEPSTTNHAVNAFTLSTNIGNDTVTALTVTFTGTDVNDVAASGVKIYEDNGGTANEWDATDTLIDTVSFSGTTASFTGLNISVDTSPNQYLVTYNIAAGAGDTNTLQGAITAATTTDTLVNNDTTDATLTVMHPVTTIGDGTSPANKNVEPSTTNHAVNAFTLATNVGTDTVTALTVTFTGTDVNDVASSGVKIYEDNGGTANEWDATDTLIDTVSFSGTTASFTGLNISVDTSPNQYLVTYNIAAGATDTNTMQGAITAATTTDTLVNNDTTDATLTVMHPVTTIGDGTSPPTKDVAPSTTNHAVDAFTLITNIGTDTVTALTVTFTGTDVNDVAASGVKIYEDNGGTANEWDATDTLIDTVSFSGTTASFTGLNISVNTSATQYLVTYDIAAGATETNTLQGAITAATTTDTLVNNDTTDATLTVVFPVTTIGDGTSPASKNVEPSGTNYAVDAFTLATNIGTDTVTSLTVTFSGTDVNDVAASGIKIYEDNGGTANEWDATDTLIDTVSFSGTTASFTGLNISVDTSPNQYLVTYDIAAGATETNTLQGAITAATSTETVVNNDTTDATLTVVFPVTTIGDGTSPGNKTVAPSSTNNAVDAFTLATNVGTDTVTSLTVTFSGTDVNDVASSGVKIYEDDGSTANEWDAGDTLEGSASFSGSTADVSVSISVGDSATQYLVTYDMAAGATGVNTLQGAITAATTTDPLVNNDTTDATLTVSSGGDIKISTGRFTLNTGTGTQQITGVGFQPKAYILFYTKNNSDDFDSTAGEGLLSIGMTDGINQFCMTSGAEDNQSSADVGRRGFSDRVLASQDAQSSQSVDGEASHVSMNTDGFTINIVDDFSDPASPLIHYIAFGGVDLSVDVGMVDLADTMDSFVDVTAPGFEADVVIASYIGVFLDAYGDGNNDRNSFSLGWAVNPDRQASGNQFSMSVGSQDGQSPAQSRSRFDNVRAGTSHYNNATDAAFEIGSFDGSGFNVTTRLASAITNEIMGYMALKLGTSNPYVYTVARPARTTAGNDVESGAGFEPIFLMGIGGAVVTTANSDTDGSSIAIGITDGTDTYAISQFETDNVTPSNIHSRVTSTQFMSANLHTSAIDWEATFSSFDTNGWTINYGDAAGVAYQNAFLAIGDDPGGPSTTIGDGTSPANKNVAPSSTNNAVNAFTLVTGSGADTVTELTVTFTGTDVNDVAASGVKIYEDDGGTANEWDATDTLIDTVSFSGTTASFTGLNISVDTSATQYLVTYDIAAGATLTNTLQGAITAATTTNPLVNHDTTDATLTVTVVDPTTTIGDGTSPANKDVTQSSTNNAVDAFTLVTNVGTDTVTALTVTFTGTDVNDVAASGVKIYEDNGGTANEWDASDTLIDTTSFSGTTANFTGLNISVDTSATQYLVTYDIAAGATVTNTLQGTITAATVTNTLVNNDTTDATLTVTSSVIQLIGSWGTGTSHTKPVGSNRALVFIVGAEVWGDEPTLTSVTYGGQSLTKISDVRIHTDNHGHVEIWMLDEAGIAAASSTTFVPTWNVAPEDIAYSHAFFSNVHQTNPIYKQATDSTVTTTPNPITAAGLSTNNGDMVVVAAGAFWQSGTYAPQNGFTEGNDQQVVDVTLGTAYKAATGAAETPSMTHSDASGSPYGQVIAGVVIRNVESPAYTEGRLLGWWRTGLIHPAESGNNRVLVFVAAAEKWGSTRTLTSVTYGGQSLAYVDSVTAELEASTSNNGFLEVWILDEAGIAAATDDTFVPTWDGSLDHEIYSSAFFSGVDQTTPTGAKDTNSGASPAPNPITTAGLSTSSGDMVVKAAMAGFGCDKYTPQNGFSEGNDHNANDKITLGTAYKEATGATETPSMQNSDYTSDLTGQLISGFVIKTDVSPTTTIGDGTSPANKDVAPDSANNAVDAFTLVTDSGTDTVTALTVTFTGTDVSDVASSGVKIYEDDGTTANEWDSGDTLEGTASFSGTTADVTVSISVDTSATQYLVTYDIAAGATATNTLQGAVTAATVTNTLVNNDTTDATLTIADCTYSSWRQITIDNTKVSGYTTNTWQIAANERDAWDDSSSGSLNACLFGDSTWYDHGGYQFAVTIPQGATIISAKLKVYSTLHDGATGAYTARINIEDVDSASAFAGTANDIIGRSYYTTTVDWSIPAAGLDTGTWTDSPDIKDLIQHIVNKPGWSSGNYMNIAVWGVTSNGGCSEDIRDYNDEPNLAAKLEVTYQASSGSHQDFPLLVNLSGDWLKTTTADTTNGRITNDNGYDIIFKDTSGTQLDHEIENYDGTNGTLVAWVRIPTLSYNTDTVIYMYYGNSCISASQENVTGVWNTNYKGVWHLHDDFVNSIDDNSATESGSVNATGQIADGQNFDNSTDYASPTVSGLPSGSASRTLSCWFKPTSDTLRENGGFLGYPYNSEGAGTNNWFELTYSNSDAGDFQKFTLHFYANNDSSTNTFAPNNWYHLVATYDGSSAKLYVNEALEVNETVSLTTAVNSSGENFNIGDVINQAVDTPRDGIIDEVRISDTNRSADWIQTEFKNQSDPSTFYSVGEEGAGCSYSHKRKITIQNSQVIGTADHDNFPVLVNLTDTALRHIDSGGHVTNSSGYDIIFRASDETTQLDHEIEDYDGTAGTVVAWVRIPTLDHDDDTVIYMYYGNNCISTSQENVTGVWDSNFVGVFHLADTTTSGHELDSTSNNNHGLNAWNAEADDFDDITDWTDDSQGTYTVEESPAGQLHLLAGAGDSEAERYKTGMAYEGDSTYTVEVRVKFDELANFTQVNDGVLVGAGNYRLGNDNAWGIAFFADRIHSYFGDALIASRTINTGQWYVYRFVVTDDDDVAIYEDGTYITTANDIGYDYDMDFSYIVLGVNNYGASPATTEAHFDWVRASTETSGFGATRTTDGQINGSLDFDGIDDYVTTGTTGFSTSAGTVEAWVNVDTFPPASGCEYIFSHCLESPVSDRVYIQLWDDNTWGTGMGDTFDLIRGSALGIDTWYHLAITWDGANVRGYLNGSLNFGPTAYTGLSTVRDIYVMAWNTPAQWADGTLDELRVSSTNRSIEWIQTELNNQNTPSSFYVDNGEESAGTVTLSNHTVGQEPDNFGDQSSYTGVELFAFKLTNATDSDVTVKKVLFPLSAVTGILEGDFDSLYIYIDSDNDGIKDVEETTTVGGLGEVNAGVTDITFTDSFTITANTAVDYILVGDVSDLLENETLTIDLNPENVTITAGHVTGTAPTSATHTADAQCAFLYRRPITIQASKVFGPPDLTDFPVLISLSGTWLRRSTEDPANGHINNEFGHDIIFRAADGRNQLDHEIEEYDGSASGGTLVAWVRIPTLDHDDNTVIYMYYGNSCIDTSTQNVAGVWNTNFVGVWHLKEEQSGSTADDLYQDSTSKNNHGNDRTDATAQNGKINGGQQFGGDADGDSVEVPHHSTLNLTGDMTISYWFHATENSGVFNRIVDKGYSTSYYFGGGDGTNDLTFYLSGTEVFDTADSTFTIDAWHYAAVTYDITSGDATLILDGTESGPWNYTGGITGNTNTVYISYSGLDYDFAGYIDEVRISDTDRTAEWLKTEYSNQSDPATFYNIGNEEEPAPTAVDLISFTATGLDEEVLVEWETAQEVDNLGFNLYRSTELGGSYSKLNRRLMPGLLSSVTGKLYTYVDEDVTRSVLYYYMLEDVDLDGTRTMHGPICVDWDGDGQPDDYIEDPDDDTDTVEEDPEVSIPDTEFEELESDPSDWTPSNIGGSATWVKISSFKAYEQDEGVALEWETSYELDNLGFHIYRELDGKYLRITPDLVPGSVFSVGEGSELPAGQSYEYWDALTKQTGREFYWLDSKELNGGRASFGPIETGISGKPIPKGRQARHKSIADYQVSKARARVKVKALRDELSVAPIREQKPRAIFYEVVPDNTPTEPRLPPSEEQWALSAQPGVKIYVKEGGWYRVGEPELVAAGLRLGIDPRYLQLYRDGEEQSILVRGDEDGRFDPVDAVEFYGTALDTPFTDARAYWLVVGSRPGRRIDTPFNDLRIGPDKRMRVPRGLRGRGAPLSFPYTVELKEQTFYFAALKTYERDNFFGSVIATDPVDQLLAVAHPEPSSPAEAMLEVWLQGATEIDHHIKIFFNYAEVGEVFFGGQDQCRARIPISQESLLEGDNVVTLVAQGGSMDVSLVDYVRITYWRTYTADEDVMEFKAQGGEWVSIGGFSNPEIRMVDITDEVRMLNVRGKVKPDGSDYAVTIKVPRGGERTLFAFTEENIRQPARISANAASSWHELSQGANVIILGHGDLLESVRPLKTLREQQGMSVVLVDVEDLYDEFNFGAKSPWAIKDFLNWAYQYWTPQPRYLILVGDTSYDPRNYLGYGEFDLMPTKLVNTEKLKTASDDWFVDFDDDELPEMAVGRLPAASAAEATAMVAKIIDYEGYASLMNEVLLVSDTNDLHNFELATALVAKRIPRSLSVNKIYRGKSATARTELFNLLNQGQLLVNYFGHGSTQIWNGNLLTYSDVWSLTNSPNLPFFISTTCLNGFFQDPYSESLAEGLLKAPLGGAIAVWTSSGLTDPEEQIPMNEELITLLFNGQGLTIGEAVMRAKQAATNSDVRRTWILFGDPTLRLR